MRKHGLKGYIKDIYNITDVIQYMACMIVVIHNLINNDFIDLKYQRYVASILFVMIWFSLFDKLRLFSSTAFYIKLTFTTIRSSCQFLLIFFISLMAMGSSIFILN